MADPSSHRTKIPPLPGSRESSITQARAQLPPYHASTALPGAYRCPAPEPGGVPAREPPVLCFSPREGASRGVAARVAEASQAMSRARLASMLRGDGEPGAEPEPKPGPRPRPEPLPV